VTNIIFFINNEILELFMNKMFIKESVVLS